MRTRRSHFKFPSPKKPLKIADFNVLWNNEPQSDPVTANCRLADTPLKWTPR